MSTYMDVNVGDPLTPREQQAVEIWDRSHSYKDVADAFGLTGGGRDGNAGNYVRRGLRKLGRGDEIRSAGSGSSTASRTVPAAKVPDNEQKLLDALEFSRSEQDRLQTRLDTLRAESEMDDKAIFEAEVDRLAEIVANAQAELEKFQGMDDDQTGQFVSAFRNRAQSALDREGESLETGLAALTDAIEENEVMLEALQAVRERKAAERAEVVDEDEPDEDEEDETADEGSETVEAS